jgi:hypothetical protein
MFETVTADLGGKLADRLALVLLSPAFAFWALGAAAWVWTRPRAADHALSHLAALSGLAQGLLTLGALLAVAATGVVIQRTVPAVLRLLQGYWPAPLRSALAARWRHRLAAYDDAWQALYPRWDEGKATDKETAELLATERRLARLPGTPEQVMPTRLGNVMRAAEARPFEWYGLDSVLCWSRLWLVLPDPAKAEVNATRADLEAAVTWGTWAALTVVWVIFTPWALLVALVACLFSYLALIGSAVRFGELVNAVYDLYRGLLYDALGYARPQDKQSERDVGIALTQALLRGPA